MQLKLYSYLSSCHSKISICFLSLRFNNVKAYSDETFSSQNVLFPTFCCQLDKYPLSSKLMKKCGLYFDIHSKIESPSLEILGNDLEVLFQVRQCVRRLLLFLSEINSPNVWPAKGGRKTCVTYCVRRTGNNWTKSRKTVLACDFVTLFRSFFLFLFASIFFQ